MLNCDNPTHPEYLAMLKCIDERRDERIRLSGLELQYRMDVLRRRAVAERAQIMSQFYQSVRASREKVLEELGHDWYEIQHERRRQANSIPDYGIRFSTDKAQHIRNAVAYNKEVSILAGFAKHVGFPAAPPINGASDDQLEHDFEAIHVRLRDSLPEQLFMWVLQSADTSSSTYAKVRRKQHLSRRPRSKTFQLYLLLGAWDPLGNSSLSRHPGPTQTIRLITSSGNKCSNRRTISPLLLPLRLQIENTHSLEGPSRQVPPLLSTVTLRRTCKRLSQPGMT